MTTLKDASGKKTGEIKAQGDKQVLYDAHGHRKGYYIQSTDVTYDGSGRRVGSGNLLASLL